MKKIIVFYHGGCWDGFGGAWAAWKKFGGRADYVGLKYEGEKSIIYKGIKGKQVYFIDYTYKAPLMKIVVKQAKRTVVLDHHVTGKESGKLANKFVYDLKSSGATIAWNYFHPKKKMPKILTHIEDMDLWKFKISNTREVISALNNSNKELVSFNKLANNFEKQSFRRNFIEKGRTILSYEDILIKKLVSNAELVKFEGRNIFSVNSPILMSEIGNELAKKKSIGIVWSKRNGKISVSLRSVGNHDVSKLAAKYNGGGHKNAAGFVVFDDKKVPWKIIKQKND